MPTLARIAVHPIKALDPVDRERASITEVGGLAGDRVYAVVDTDGEYVNGKRTAAVHRLRADVDLDANRVTLGVRDGTGDGSENKNENRTDGGTGAGDGIEADDRAGGEPHEFHLDRDRSALESWLGDYFGVEVALSEGPGGAQTDGAIYADDPKPGPTLISEATLREVASWYDGIGPEEMRLRLRPNLVVEGVPAFWEDRLVADGGRRCRVGDVTLVGTKPVPRCVVPTRDPHTGAVTEGFRETFVRKREETLPPWADRSAFDGLYAVMVATRIPAADRGGELAVGDEVTLADDGIDRDR